MGLISRDDTNRAKPFRYFKGGLTYLKGGVASGFKSASDRVEKREPRLLMVKGRGENILLKEVELSRKKMNSGGAPEPPCRPVGRLTPWPCRPRGVSLAAAPAEGPFRLP